MPSGDVPDEVKEDGTVGSPDPADGDLDRKEGAVTPSVAGFEDANLFRRKGDVFGELGRDDLGGPLPVPVEDGEWRFWGRIGGGEGGEISRIDPDHPGKVGVGPKEASGGVGEVETIRGHFKERGEIGDCPEFFGRVLVLLLGRRQEKPVSGDPKPLFPTPEAFRGFCLHPVPPCRPCRRGVPFPER